MTHPLDSEKDLQDRLLAILRGISQDLKDTEIAAQLGVRRWIIQKDVELMQKNRDTRLKEAKISREVIRSEKMRQQTGQQVHSKHNQAFLQMMGITLEEKSFRNMIDFYKSDVIKIMNAEDQSTVIRTLSKGDRMTMLHSGILSGKRGSLATWKITTRAKEYLEIPQ